MGEEARPGLFWLALTLVALVIAYFVARALFVPRSTHRPWLVIALLALSGAGHAALHQLLMTQETWRSEGEAGWSSPYAPPAGHAGFAYRHARQRV